ALLHGLAAVPAVPAAARRAARDRLAELGPAGLHAELARVDPVMSARLRPTDSQRVARAYEVIAGTGRSLAAWQEALPLRIELPTPCTGIALMPPRAALYARIERRLRAMIEAGALTELEELRRRGLDPDLPLMKAVAVPELLARLEGRIDLATATDRAIVQTRRYAKRQMTWQRHRLSELRGLEAFGDSADLPRGIWRPLLTGPALGA
ncbi:MAG: tRNA (adenosine(37)-N6)-dimethylallyltransferase, partial [Geminicoccaceae bacterium]